MNMANRLAALTLSVRDYSTDERAEVRFNGEVVSLDDSGKVNIYRFFETENGTMMVTVDYSKEKIVVREQSETVLLSLELSEDLFGNVSYRIDGNRLDLRSKMKRFETADGSICMEYDLFASDDLQHPLTCNQVEIRCEVIKPC